MMNRLSRFFSSAYTGVACPWRQASILCRRSTPSAPFLCLKASSPWAISQARGVGFMVPILKGAGRLLAMFAGRRMRLWWSRLTPEERGAYTKRMARYKYIFYTVGATVGGGGLLFYSLHLEEAPITKRRRLMILTEAEVEHFVEEERERCMRRAFRLVLLRMPWLTTNPGTLWPSPGCLCRARVTQQRTVGDTQP